MFNVNNCRPIEDLREIHKNGVPWSAFYRVLYYTRLFRYIHKNQYERIMDENGKKLDHRAINGKALDFMMEKEYLTKRSPEVYCGTNKCNTPLQRVGVGDLIPAVPDKDAMGKSNVLNNTDVYIQALRVPDFYALLFHDFGYLEPDAILVQKREEKYKVTMLEVEASKKKPDWFDIKKENYLRLAKDMYCYEVWVEKARILDLRIPTLEEFKFNVTFICSFTKELGEGFNFTPSLC